MFKKISLWVVLLIIYVLLIISLLFGAMVRQEIEGSKKFGKISEYSYTISKLPSQLYKLYLLTIDPDTDFSEKTSIRVDYDIQKSSIDTKYIILPRYDYNLNQSVIELIEIPTNEVLHSWVIDYESFFSKEEVKKNTYLKTKRFLPYHPYLTERGNLIFNGTPSNLLKVNPCGKIISKTKNSLFHHSINKDHENVLIVPSSEFIRIKEENSIYEDNYINYLDENLNIIKRISLTKIFKDNNYDSILFGMSKMSGDPFHLNDIEPIKSDGEYWNKGDLFLSLRNLSLIIHYRPSSNKILKLIRGPFFQQHDVDIISDSKIALFNNNSKVYKLKRSDNRNSNVVIYDFKTSKFQKYLDDELKLINFRTSESGNMHIFPDYSAILESSFQGVLLYFDNKKELIWTFNNHNEDKSYYLSWFRVVSEDRVKNTFKK